MARKTRRSSILLFDAVCIINSLTIGIFIIGIASLFYADGTFHKTIVGNCSFFDFICWLLIPIMVSVAIQIVLLKRWTKVLSAKYLIPIYFLYELGWIIIFPAIILSLITMYCLFIVVIPVALGVIALFIFEFFGIDENDDITSMYLLHNLNKK